MNCFYDIRVFITDEKKKEIELETQLESALDDLITDLKNNLISQSTRKKICKVEFVLDEEDECKFVLTTTIELEDYELDEVSHWALHHIRELAFRLRKPTNDIMSLVSNLIPS